MIRVSPSEFRNEFERYQDIAETEPVMVTHDGYNGVVVMSAGQYHRLKKRDREVLRAEDFTDAEVEAMRRAEPSPEAEKFNREFEL